MEIKDFYTNLCLKGRFDIEFIARWLAGQA